MAADHVAAVAATLTEIRQSIADKTDELDRIRAELVALNVAAAREIAALVAAGPAAG